MNIILSLGGNEKETKQSFENAILLIETNIGEINLKSKIYTSEAWGFKEKTAAFLNQIIEIETVLLPKEILLKTQEIEKKLGRTTKSISANYQDRIIDIDILFYENLIFKSPQLTIPHYLLHKRKFILEPLSEILPNFMHPLLNKTIKNLLLSFNK